MSLQLHDLADPGAVDDYLFEHLTEGISDAAIADARAVAAEAVALEEPPAGAHVVLARLAELDGDLEGLRRRTRMALASDATFGPALDDQEYLDFLQAGAGPRAGAAHRAELLFHKADRWSGRVPQLDDQFALAARVLRVDESRDHPVAAALVAQWQFLAVLLFEGGLLARFALDCEPLLSKAERELLASWDGVRHRLVRLDEQEGRRGRFTDVVTGETLEVTVLHEPGIWPADRKGVALLVPAGNHLALIGEPSRVDEEMATVLQGAHAVADPMVIPTITLQLCLVAKLEQALAERSAAA